MAITMTSGLQDTHKLDKPEVQKWTVWVSDVGGGEGLWEWYADSDNFDDAYELAAKLSNHYYVSVESE